jgi:cwf18 pre-mRNA splicing factor
MIALRLGAYYNLGGQRVGTRRDIDDKAFTGYSISEPDVSRGSFRGAKGTFACLTKKKSWRGCRRLAVCVFTRAYANSSRTSRGEANDVLSNRNFDPQTRTLRKHQADTEMEDTVEKNVQGLAEHILVQDEAKRAQDLVKDVFRRTFNPIQLTRAGSSEYRAETAELGSQKGNGKETSKIRKADSASYSYAHSYARLHSIILHVYLRASY